MLIYLESVIEDLVVTAIVVGVVLSYARLAWERVGGRAVAGGVVLGVVSAAVMAYMKQNTALVNTSDWNIFIFQSCLFLLVVAGLCQAVRFALSASGRRRVRAAAGAGEPEEAEGAGGEDLPAGSACSAEPGRGRAYRVLGYVVLAALALFVALRIFYKMPDVFNYPANFGISTDNLVSSDFAYRIIGWLLGILVPVIACIALSKAYRALGSRALGVATAVITAFICFTQTVTWCQILIAKRVIKKGTELYDVMFPLTTWFSKNTILITMIIMGVAIVLAAVVIALSLRDKDPYDNPAQHRKNKARWRNRRRWAVCAIVFLVFSLFTVTYVKDYNNRGPEIAESEEVEISGGYMRIPLDQVSDGHLHRFTYKTEAGVEVTPEAGQPYKTAGGVGVRVIVIKKPGANAYGVGLDACDICGTTGYYERDGQVVCSKCDVVMNINTIGFKGGCNPIVIDYEMKDGYILISTEALAAYEKIPGSNW